MTAIITGAITGTSVFLAFLVLIIIVGVGGFVWASKSKKQTPTPDGVIDQARKNLNKKARSKLADEQKNVSIQKDKEKIIKEEIKSANLKGLADLANKLTED